MGECCVCYDETSFANKCGHHTCHNCVSQLTTSECPMCRQPLVFEDLNIKFRGIRFDKLYFDDGNIYKGKNEDETHLAVFRQYKSSGLKLNNSRTGFVFTSDCKYRVHVNTKGKNDMVKMRLYDMDKMRLDGSKARKYSNNEAVIYPKKFSELFINIPLKSGDCVEVTFYKL